MNPVEHNSSLYAGQYEKHPELPPRPQEHRFQASGDMTNASAADVPHLQAFSGDMQTADGNQHALSHQNHQSWSQPTQNFPPTPQRQPDPSLDDTSDSSTYLRDPHKLVGYLVPFPLPNFKKGLFHSSSGKEVPQRFLIYTPPPPPLNAPADGEKEGKAHKLQRKWQDEVRQAKTNPQKVASWKGLKGRATKGISAAMSWTTSSNLDFLNRIPGMDSGSEGHDAHADDGHDEGDETHKTVALEEMVMLYPSSLPGSPEQIRQEFLENMLRSKTKAQKDSIIASGLLPVAACVDILATFVWPFGGLLEIDGVWAYSSIRGAKTARSVTKRLNSSGVDTGSEDAQLRLVFTPTPRMEVLYRYLAAECHKRNPKYFERPATQPTETEVLEAIGWAPSQTGGETRNWEDEQWETQEVKDDFAATMKKGSREWDKWVKGFEKDPEKASKK